MYLKLTKKHRKIITCNRLDREVNTKILTPCARKPPGTLFKIPSVRKGRGYERGQRAGAEGSGQGKKMRPHDSHRRKERRGKFFCGRLFLCLECPLRLHSPCQACEPTTTLQLLQHKTIRSLPHAHLLLFAFLPSILVRNDDTNAVREKKLQQSKHRSSDEVHSRRPRRGHRGRARQFAARVGRWRHRR